MICPKCGENNSENFRYCGMCGTSLELRRPAGAPRTASSEAPRAFQSESSPALQNDVTHEAARSRTAAQATGSAVHDAPPTAGPSFLGLNQPFNDDGRNGSGNRTSTGESFSGLDSFFEPEEPGVSARGIILLLVLLAALGGGGWWAYTHYNGAKSGTVPQSAAEPPATQNTPDTATDTPAATPKAPEFASTNPPSSQNSAATQPMTNPPTESATSIPPAVVEPPAAASKSDRNPPAPPKAAKRAEQPQPARNQKIARAENKPAPRPPAAVPASGDKGDAEFKRGEAYLYGRGVPKNCDQAIKNLKEASAKQNAKARSAFGTMYATGHCVPRNLPTSYSWFAQALRVDPNNQILEKDLTAVWNQMTPPERQMAAKGKP